jgi:hypothetical protein
MEVAMAKLSVVIFAIGLHACAAEEAATCPDALRHAQRHVREARLSVEAIGRGGSVYAYAKVPPIEGSGFEGDLAAAGRRLAKAQERLALAQAGGCRSS